MLLAAECFLAQAGLGPGIHHLLHLLSGVLHSVFPQSKPSGFVKM
jgi:hypothetical protein